MEAPRHIARRDREGERQTDKEGQRGTNRWSETERICNIPCSECTLAQCLHAVRY